MHVRNARTMSLCYLVKGYGYVEENGGGLDRYVDSNV